MTPKRNILEQQIPKSLQNIEQWQISRRQLIKGALIIGAISQVPFLSSCLNHNEEPKLPFGTLNTTEKQILKDVQNILFPTDGGGPSASDINALEYLQWVIMDPRMDPDEVKYILNGIAWLNETSEEEYSKTFEQLTNNEKENLISIISKENWGESWLSVLLTLIFEALLSDPQYGGNPKAIGWEWLEHTPGNPRATKDLLYDKIFVSIKK